MKQQILNFLTVFLLGITLSCHKDTEVLPEATKSGKGVFACMYDGKVINIEGVRAVYSTVGLDNPKLSIVADYSTVSDPETIYLGINNITKAGAYKLGSAFAGIAVSINMEDGYRSYSGTIDITTFDTINHVISGTFNADLLPSSTIIQQSDTEPALKDTLSIRSGRFDLPLSIYYYR